MRQTPIYYYSSTSGLVRRFAERLGRPVFDLGERAVRTSEVDGAWVLLTPSYKSGNARNDTIPEPVKRFLRSAHNRRHLVGLIGSGNRNFGAFYQKAARELAQISRRPVLQEFELSGTPEDLEECRRIMGELDEALELARSASPAAELAPSKAPAT